LNKGSSGDPGVQSIIGRARARTGGIWYIYQGPQQMLSADCDAFGLTADMSGIKVWVIPLQDPWLGQSTNDIQRITVPSLLSPSLPYMDVHVMAEGTVVSRGPVPMHPQLVRCHSGPSDEGGQKSMTLGESMSRKLSGRQYGSHRAVGMEVVGFRCNPWRWYRGEEREYI
jgi:hypothetical protein